MAEDVDDILKALLELPRRERAVVAAVLTDSLERGPTEQIEAAWIEEAKQRISRVRAGESSPIDSRVVERELDEIVATASNPSERATG
ncbi:MAG: addiction module protein [Myxococcota bacterium]